MTGCPPLPLSPSRLLLDSLHPSLSLSLVQVGPIYQTLDVSGLTARNDETIRWGSRRFRFLGLRLKRFVEADLEPLTSSKVAVQFRKFGIGPLRIKAPKSARGELDTTYLDENLRISRGDKGNLFLMIRDEP
jgi:hypothetical protein